MTPHKTLGLKPLAPAEFVGMQACPGRDSLALFVLTAPIPGHPKDSTVSEQTLREAGYAVPSYRKGRA